MNNYFKYINITVKAGTLRLTQITNTIKIRFMSGTSILE